MKRALLLLALLASVGLYGQAKPQTTDPPRAPRRPFSVVEASIPEMQAAMREGRVTSRDLVVQYLTRIALYNSKLNAVITVNPNALREAAALDRERAQGR